MNKSNLQLKIGSHKFKVAVAEEEKVEMLAAAKRVDSLLADIKRNGVADGERAAIMAALNIANAVPTTNGNANNVDLLELEAVIDEVLNEINDK